MMLKTSSNKLNPFLNMFKITFRSNIGITVLGIIAFLLICPSYTVIAVKNVEVHLRNQWISNWVSGFPLFCAIVSSIAVVGTNLLNFSFMYKRPSADFVDSLPVTRAELFFARTLSSFLVAVIPTFVSLASFGVALSLMGYGAYIKNLLISLICILVLTALTSAFSMIFIISSASVFDFLLSFLTVNAGFLVLGIIFLSLLEELLIGYANTSSAVVLRCLSPFFFSFGGFISFLESGNTQALSAGFFIKCALLILAFGIFALLLYKKRKSESAGKAFAYKYLHYVCTVTVAISSAYVFGGIFSEGKTISLLFFTFALIGALLSAVVYCAITSRGFKTVKSSLILGGISFVVLFITVFAVKSDITGFCKRIPDKNEIKSAEIEYIGNEAVYKNPEFVLKLHKKLVGDKSGKYLVKDNHYGNDGQTVTLKYNLKNGKTLKRIYGVHTKPLKSEITEFLSSDERFESVKNKITLSNAKTVEVNIYKEDENAEISKDIRSFFTVKEVNKFLEIYKNDLKKNGINSETFQGRTALNVTIQWSANQHYYGYYFPLAKEYTETLKYIDSLNLSERTAEE